MVEDRQLSHYHDVSLNNKYFSIIFDTHGWLRIHKYKGDMIMLDEIVHFKICYIFELRIPKIYFRVGLHMLKFQVLQSQTRNKQFGFFLIPKKCMHQKNRYFI